MGGWIVERVKKDRNYPTVCVHLYLTSDLLTVSVRVSDDGSEDEVRLGVEVRQGWNPGC